MGHLSCGKTVYTFCSVSVKQVLIQWKLRTVSDHCLVSGHWRSVVCATVCCENLYDIPELGTPQQCHDNVTKFSGHKVVGYCMIFVFIAAPSFRHQDLKFFRIYSCP